MPGTRTPSDARAKRASAGRGTRTGYLVLSILSPIPCHWQRQCEAETRQGKTPNRLNGRAALAEQRRIRLLPIPRRWKEGKAREDCHGQPGPRVDDVCCWEQLQPVKVLQSPGHHLTPPQSTRRPRQAPAITAPQPPPAPAERRTLEKPVKLTPHNLPVAVHRPQSPLEDVAPRAWSDDGSMAAGARPAAGPRHSRGSRSQPCAP